MLTPIVVKPLQNSSLMQPSLDRQIQLTIKKFLSSVTQKNDVTTVPFFKCDFTLNTSTVDSSLSCATKYVESFSEFL